MGIARAGRHWSQWLRMSAVTATPARLVTVQVPVWRALYLQAPFSLHRIASKMSDKNMLRLLHQPTRPNYPSSLRPSAYPRGRHRRELSARRLPLLREWHDHPIIPDHAPAVSDPMGTPAHGDLRRNSLHAHRAAGLGNFSTSRPAPQGQRCSLLRRCLTGAGGLGGAEGGARSDRTQPAEASGSPSRSCQLPTLTERHCG